LEQIFGYDTDRLIWYRYQESRTDISYFFYLAPAIKIKFFFSGPRLSIGSFTEAVFVLRSRLSTNFSPRGSFFFVKFCKLSRLRWAGHVIRQDGDYLSRRVLLSEPGGKRPRGRPRLRSEEGVKEDAAKLGCRNRTVVALNREGWRKLLKEAEAHPGLQCRWRERERERGGDHSSTLKTVATGSSETSVPIY